MAERWPDVHRELVAAIELLERHHADLVDVEFTVRAGPAAPPPVPARAAVADGCAPDRRRHGRRSSTSRSTGRWPWPAAGTCCRHRRRSSSRCLTRSSPSTCVVTGLAAGPGRGVGALVVSVEDALRRHEAGEPVVLVRPDDVPGRRRRHVHRRGIVTASGGLVSHAAVVARSWGIPAVVGAAGLAIDDAGVTVGGRRVAAGEVVTVDGTTGMLLIGDPSRPVGRAAGAGRAAPVGGGRRSPGRREPGNLRRRARRRRRLVRSRPPPARRPPGSAELDGLATSLGRPSTPSPRR